MGEVRTAVKGKMSDQVKGLVDDLDKMITQKKDDLQQEGAVHRERNIRSLTLLEVTKGYLEAVKGALDQY